jgi:hypothetical protein
MARREGGPRANAARTPGESLVAEWGKRLVVDGDEILFLEVADDMDGDTGEYLLGLALLENF